MVVLVSLRVGLVVLDRHFSLPGVVWDVRYLVETIGDTAAFAVLHAAVPVVWAVLAAGWWLTRPSHRRRTWGPLLGLLAVAGLFGSWAWFVTAARHLRRAFDVEGLPQGLGTFGLTEADVLESLIVIGLPCLIGLAAVSLALILYETPKPKVLGDRPS